MKRGERQTLKTNSRRQRLNLHGAIHAETHEVTVIESDTVNTDSTLRLIETLNQKYFLAQEILLIADNAKYHYSKAVQEALKDYPRVRFVFLPSYSPNLNLIERFWGFLKRRSCITGITKISDLFEGRVLGSSEILTSMMRKLLL
ncbi:MAG: IS630 family transposase [Thiothrix sp.]|nr:MAG: IS630 family transposase [Thiothrix sp.]